MMQNNLSSGNLTADKRADYARMLGETGDFQAAGELMLQALELAPDWVAGWFQAGGYFEKVGNTSAAIAAFERVLNKSPADRFGAGLKLAHLRGGNIAAPQTAYVEALFDDYAAKFDKSLVETLGYRVPELLAEMVDRHGSGRNFVHCIDLGCGTGLMVQALGDAAEMYTGIDLSAAMLAKAAQKKLYQKLIKADLVLGMSETGSADLIVAADVFMYFGSLEPVISEVRTRLVPNGLFVFSVELSRANSAYELRPSMRHAHSAEYIGQCLSDCGFETLETNIAIIRMDGAEAIEGLLTIVRKLSPPLNADG